MKPLEQLLHTTNCLFILQLFLEVGNDKANSFWAANLPLEEELYSGASTEQRATFMRRKYRERKYTKVLEDFNDLEELNQVSILWECSRIQLPVCNFISTLLNFYFKKNYFLVSFFLISFVDLL